MNPFLKFIAIISIIPLLIGLYFFDNIKGYYRFKLYCEKEGGLKVFDPIKKGVGLLAKNKEEAHSAALLENIGFVRYKDEDGNFYDIKYLGGNFQVDVSFDKKPADLSVEPNYQWKNINSNVFGELRLSKTGYEIFNFSKNSVSVRYSIFYYSRFDRRKTLLDAPSHIGCFNNFSKDYRYKDPLFKEIDSAFQN
ncbi:hypothetical protein D0C16_05740 [Cellvibrio sp. KY-GH-1]|uniref:hypothetical protein n=1 Tax=Cellvibrio sp. KY-GH-1 TaxID=2303332 RepID=UPI00124571CC|nr:hypothetical protein [Cellvibrio sp. KY-GH-1]QEY15517.1 hypothetical protein D0C16_05740 [Cellvibrio sp. KY-GH-1]